MRILIAQTILFTVYVLWITIKYGVQKSISDSWYTGNSFEKIAFTLLFAFAIGCLQFFSGSLWFALSGAFLVFVGVTPDFKSQWSTTGTIHTLGASGAIILALIGLIANNIWLPIVPILLSILVLYKTNNRTYWIEIVAFYSIITGKLFI